MNTSDSQLSSELQELYLQNKEWLSDIHFLEDETRFFQKLFDKVLSSSIDEDKFEEVKFIDSSLSELQNRRAKLKTLINSQLQLLQSLIKDQTQKMDLQFIEANTKASNEIKALFSSDKLIKKELYTLVEQVILKQKDSHLLN